MPILVGIGILGPLLSSQFLLDFSREVPGCLFLFNRFCLRQQTPEINIKRQISNITHNNEHINVCISLNQEKGFNKIERNGV